MLAHHLPIATTARATKVCSGCKEAKSPSEFYTDITHSDGLATRCRLCNRQAAKRSCAPKGRRINRQANYRRKYGIEVEEYERLLAEQGGVCAVCGGSDNRRLNTDHNHATGEVRGLLCSNCNLGIGKFRDNPEFLTAAAAYLERTSPCT